MAMETSLSVKVPDGLLVDIDELVHQGKYSSRSDFVKAAVRALLIHSKNREIYDELKTREHMDAELTHKQIPRTKQNWREKNDN